MVDGDGERHAELVRARVSLPHGDRGGVQLGGDAVRAELARDDVGELVHARVVEQREDRALDGRDDGREPEHRLLLVVLSHVEGVLEHAVHDAPDPERGLDHGGREVAPRDLLGFHGDLHHAGQNLHLAGGGGERRFTVGGDFRVQRECILRAQRGERVGHRLDVLLERLAHVFFVGLHHEHLFRPGLGEALVCGELRAALGAVRLEVKRAAVGEADALYPPVRALDLGVPAVLRVVRHLVLQVLPEPQARGIDADLEQKQLRARDEVPQRLVGDDALGDGVARRHRERPLHRRQLRVAREQRELHVLDLPEARVLLVVGVHEMLNLRLRELAHAEQTLARRDLVAEGLADLRRRKGELAAVVVQQVAKVDEDALRGFRAHEPSLLAGRADLRGEHQVERVGRGEVVLGLRRLEPKRDDGGAHLLRRELLEAREHVLELPAALGREHGVRHDALEVLLHQMVRAEAVLGDDVVDHEVREAVDVARRLQHHLGGHRRALHLQHLLVENEVLAPERLQVGLHRAPGRAVVVEPGDAAVNLERGDVEQPLLQCAAHLRTEVLLLLQLLVAGRHGLLHLHVQVDLELFQLGDRRVDGRLLSLLSL